ncbi:hypothetical protein [Listeria rocourtiae]|uniref:hypothetical protein n=1 Tax=Listeria rocourtiae TaxID=647910 RepID=UPI003D2F7152
MIYKLKHHAGETVGFEAGAPAGKIVEALEVAVAAVIVNYGPSADLSNTELVEILHRGMSKYGVKRIETDKQYFGVEIDMFDLYESIAADIGAIESKRNIYKFHQSIAAIACTVYMEGLIHSSKEAE